MILAAEVDKVHSHCCPGGRRPGRRGACGRRRRLRRLGGAAPGSSRSTRRLQGIGRSGRHTRTGGRQDGGGPTAADAEPAAAAAEASRTPRQRSAGGGGRRCPAAMATRGTGGRSRGLLRWRRLRGGLDDRPGALGSLAKKRFVVRYHTQNIWSRQIVTDGLDKYSLIALVSADDNTRFDE